MRQELRWGAAATVAIVAAVGISSQSGSPPRENTARGRQAEHTAIQSKAHKNRTQTPCADSLELLQQFFLSNVTAPDTCYESGAQSSAAASTNLDHGFQTTFMIATLPDPLHTHFSLLFDRFIEAIQQGAQDEGYDYDSSWLPWETEEPTLVHLLDQDEADDRKEKREDQPGILLFRNSKQLPYRAALIVFVVGEESTRGIHRKQFENAVAWITALQKEKNKPAAVAILGPTFSGSFPSLTELLSSDKVRSGLNRVSGLPLAVYSGSASSGDAGNQFAQTPGIAFRSFLQDDNTILDRFCRYLGQTTSGQFDLKNMAVLSEDETAYGNLSATKNESLALPGHCDGATWIYYPRDISTLRAAYQNQSMFNSGVSQSNQGMSQRKSLPTDLADPAGQEHDTVRSYAGNQTPLSQEAQLLGIVDALRAHRAEYVVLRSSNTLDPLFLANFLRRDYPEARVVVLNSDLLFQRGQDAMALSGVLTLSTYPLFPWGRDWTALPPFSSHSHRVFPENSTEGTYIASRILLQSLSLAGGRKPSLSCKLFDGAVFAPSLRCQPEGNDAYVPLPDYSPPYWTEPEPCESSPPCESCRPSTWLSVITSNGTWPLAALSDHTLPPLPGQPPCTRNAAQERLQAAATSEHPKWPPMPRSIKVLLVSLFGLAIFHLSCCWFASFTAKPAFRAHFASAGRRHQVLVLIGSYLVALMALLAGWGCGIFSRMPGPPPIDKWAIWTFVLSVCIMACLSMGTNIVVVRQLHNDAANQSVGGMWQRVILSAIAFGLLIVAFYLGWVSPLERALILANRAFAYWRSMNLASGVSPIVPFFSLTAGLYIWFWYSLHGLALFGPDRPCLPPRSKLTVKIPVEDKNGRRDEELELSMFSQEHAADPVERAATPLAGETVLLFLFLFVCLSALVALVVKDVPVRSLGARRYALIFCVWLDFYFSLILAEGWQVWRSWSGVRQVLVFLDRLALRRTLGALQGFSWGSVWKMSGNVLDVRYKLLSRQLECLNHLHTSLREFIPLNSGSLQSKFDGANDCLTTVEESRKAGIAFGRWYSANYNRARASGLQLFQTLQEQIAATTGVVLTHLLLPAWREEKHSLIQVGPADKSADERKASPPQSPDELIRNAEELVCLTYLGFAQNLLGRIRTIVLGGVFLFVAATLAVSNYPFDPRPVLSAVLLVVFVAFGTVVVFVYADMHRDATLSHVTNTNPGELGSEFWFKLIGYGAAPVLGLITTVFPQWSGFLFSWLQPGLSSLK